MSDAERRAMADSLRVGDSLRTVLRVVGYDYSHYQIGSKQDLLDARNAVLAGRWIKVERKDGE